MRNFYAISLSGPRAQSQRLALYERRPDGSLDALWGLDMSSNERQRWPHMIHSTAGNLPAYHFKITPGPEHGGMSSSRGDAACQALADALARHLDEEVAIYLLEGWPSVTPHRA